MKKPDWKPQNPWFYGAFPVCRNYTVRALLGIFRDSRGNARPIYYAKRRLGYHGYCALCLCSYLEGQKRSARRNSKQTFWKCFFPQITFVNGKKRHVNVSFFSLFLCCISCCISRKNRFFNGITLIKNGRIVPQKSTHKARYKRKSRLTAAFFNGANSGNRTRNASLGSWSFTVKLYSHLQYHYTAKSLLCQADSLFSQNLSV